MEYPLRMVMVPYAQAPRQRLASLRHRNKNMTARRTVEQVEYYLGPNLPAIKEASKKLNYVQFHYFLCLFRLRDPTQNLALWELWSGKKAEENLTLFQHPGFQVGARETRKTLRLFP